MVFFANVLWFKCSIFCYKFVDKKYNLQRYFPFIILYVASNLISDCKVSDSTLLGWKIDACCSVGILKNIVPSAIEYTSFFRRFFSRYLFGDKLHVALQTLIS